MKNKTAIGGYRISAKAGSADVFLYGDVGAGWFGGVTAKQFADDLKAAGDVATINLHINSAGGDVFDGLAIYRLLVDHPAKVIAHIDSWAASIASIIAMAGDEIRIAEAGRVMIHDAWGLAIGTAQEMRSMADLLDTTTSSLADVYAARTGADLKDIRNWMAEETWFTAQEAVDNGFADSIVENLRMAAAYDPEKHKFRKPPSAAPAPTTELRDAASRRVAAMKSRMDLHRFKTARAG